MNRRHFFQTMATGASAFVAGAAPSDRVNLAVIGVRGQGRWLAGRFAAQPDVRIAALCDVDERVYANAAKAVEERTGKRPPLLGDLRRVLDDRSVDAVVVATPDHWHAPATILACQAGKDVYVEKPASHNIREGWWMVQAARKYKRIVQHGTMYRSRPSHIHAIEFAKSGKIGRLLAAKAWDVQLRKNIGRKPDSPAPAGVDYDTWVGPAPWLPFNENRFHYNWHWHWNFGTGDAGNDGVHQMDLARWALGVDYPLEASGMGRKLFFDDDQQTPDTMNVTFNYPDKVLIFEMRIWNPYGMEGQENGVAVYGSEGVIHIGRWRGKDGQWEYGFRAYDKDHQLIAQEYDQEDQGWHHRNFLECVRSRKAPAAEIEQGHISSVHSHLANIVARTGRTVRFDAQTQSIRGDPEANRLAGREYRKHWGTPQAV